MAGKIKKWVNEHEAVTTTIFFGLLCGALGYYIGESVMDYKATQSYLEILESTIIKTGNVACRCLMSNIKDHVPEAYDLIEKAKESGVFNPGATQDYFEKDQFAIDMARIIEKYRR